MGYATVWMIIHKSCAAIWKYLRPIVMPKPTTESWVKIEDDFRRLWNYPNCIGAIDGKHVNIRAPWNSGSLYYNYKKFFSTVLLAITDAKYKFIVVDIGAYGRNNDSGILSSSKFGQLLQNNMLGIPPNKCLPGTTIPVPHVFVGDEAFPLCEHIMRPYPGSQVLNDSEKKIFNYRLSRARRLVESSFGILQQKFEIFQKRIRMQPKFLDMMILACTCLHNYTLGDFGSEDVALSNNNILQNYSFDSQDMDITGNQNLDAMNIRENFKTYFISEHGAVPWQNEMITRC